MPCTFAIEIKSRSIVNKKNLKTRCAFIAGLLGCVAMTAHAEDSNKEETPKGKAIITIFSDIHSGFGHVNDDRGFNLGIFSKCP